MDILLLDIQMKAMNGVELARRIREEDAAAQIVFVTGYPDFMAEGYDVSALHYLMKPVNEAKLFEVLDKAVKNLSKREAAILIASDGGNVRLPVMEIAYAESFDHFIEVHTAKSKHTVKMPLYKLKNMLPEDFVICHRSYIVNMRYIKKITRADVVLDSGQALPLSRRLYADVNRAMMKYIVE